MRRPPKASGLPRVVEATAEELAVERFHGRDKAWTSRGGTAAQRFRYASSDGELEELTGPVAELAGQARETYVLMNNCHRDDAGATPPRCGTCSPGSPADDDLGPQAPTVRSPDATVGVGRRACSSGRD